MKRTCPKCKSENCKMMVDITIYAPWEMESQLSKSNLRKPSVEVWGANWERMAVFCKNCNWQSGGGDINNLTPRANELEKRRKEMDGGRCPAYGDALRLARQFEMENIKLKKLLLEAHK